MIFRKGKYTFLFLLILVGFFVLPDFSLGQERSLLKNFLTVENGLSHNEVTSIVQDNDGFIWIGTRGGLNRYDGYEFKIFNQEPGDSNSLVNPSIESLFVDSKGNIWIGTKSGGVSKYDPDTECFKNFATNYKQENKLLPDNRVLAFYEDSMGRIWMGTWRRGVVVYDERKDTIYQYLDNTSVRSIEGSTGGNIWVGANNGLFKFRENNGAITQQKIPANNFWCSELKFDKKRNVLWITARGLIKYNVTTNQWKRYEIGDAYGASTVHSYESICLDKQGKIWLGTWGTGFYFFDPAKEVFQRYLIYPENRATLNKDYDAVLDIFQDKDGNFWLGTNGGGLCVLTPKLEFHTVGYHPELNKGLINTRIMSVVDGHDGNLWLGTIGSGLIWSPDRENFYPVDYPPGVNKSRFFIIKYIYQDKDNRIWAGTNVGTFYIHFIDGVPNLINAAEKYRNNSILGRQAVSFLDAENMLWLGTLQNGLFLLDKRNNYKTIRHLIKHNSASGNLNSNRISFLFNDSKDRVWIGTYNGLHIFNSSDSTVQIAEDYFKISGDFSGNIITCIDEDIDGNIWVGTPNGLNRLTEIAPGQFSVTIFEEDKGLASNFIKGISHDSKGNVWISTNSGISKFVASDSTFINYNEMDGVRGKNFTEASVFRNERGELFFGGTSGLTYFQPHEIKALPKSDSPVFTGLKIQNQPVAIHQKLGSKVVLSHSILHTGNLVIPYHYNNFEIQFSALDYKSMGKNKYKYLLEDHDENWNFIGERNFINFNNLKPGEYILNVKAANSNNVWNETPRKLKIKILPPFWQTWYALTIYILVVIAIVTIIRWNAVKQVRLANKLEMAKLQHDQDRKISEMKFQFFTNISHEFRTPLTLILAPLKEILSNEQKSKLSEDVVHKIGIVQKNATRLMKLVNQLLDFRKAETGNMKLMASNSNIEAFVREVCLPFYELAKINEIHFDVHSTLQSKQLWFDREKLEVVLNNLISNAFKYVQNKGHIEVALFEEEDEILLSVSDNGPGIHSAEIKHIFDRFYQVEKNDNYGSSGIGLALVKRLVELHKGSITVTSEPNVNTEFVVALPKGNAHLAADEMVHAENTKKNFVKSEPVVANRLKQRPKVKPKSDECILVVEDDIEVNHYLESLLQTYYRVETAFDGSSGYNKALEIKPDLILSDVMMPKTDGFELCKKIKSNDEISTIPVILLTAKSAANFKLLGIQTGADEYISKPFDPDYLIEKIRHLLENRKKLQKQFSKSVRLEPADVEITSSEEQFIQKAIALIENNLQNHAFNSEVLASEMNMSSSSLYRKLKALTDSSTAEFIRSIRIKRAGQLLADKERTITEIAYDVGFSDVKHFRTVFQKHFGCSPSEYRGKL